MNKILTGLFILLNITSFAQNLTNEQIEKDLCQAYRKITSNRFNDATYNYDSIEFYNKIFVEKFSKYTSQYPSTLYYPFDSLKKEKIFIANSADHRFRIYSWNTWLGGTMQDFQNIFQYQSQDSIYSKCTIDSLKITKDEYYGFYSEILTLNDKNKTYYISVNNGMYSSKDVSEGLQIFTIENKSLVDTVKLFYSDQGLTNRIDVYFNFFSVVNRPERPIRLITYDERKKTIFIPIIDEKDQVTKYSFAYKFTGQYFEKKRRKYTNKN